eukprot:Em0007g1239a
MVGKKTASDPPSGSTTTVTSSANSPSTSPSVDQDPHQSPHQEAKNRGSIASVDRPPQDPPVLSAVGQSYIKPIFYLERPATNKPSWSRRTEPSNSCRHRQEETLLEEGPLTEMDPGRSTEEVLQTLESLPPQVAAASPVFYTGEESYMVPNLNLEVLDGPTARLALQRILQIPQAAGKMTKKATSGVGHKPHNSQYPESWVCAYSYPGGGQVMDGFTG